MARKRKNGEGTWGEKTVNGNAYRFYRDADGKYFYGKTDKEIKEKIKNAPKGKNLKNGKKGKLFGDYILTWLEGIKSGIELTTYNSYLDAINTRLINFTEYDLANVEMSALSDAMIQSYLNVLATKYSLNSIKKTYGLIKKCLRYAEVKKEIEPLNLDITVKMPSEANVAVKKKEINVPTVEEVNMICKEAYSCCKNGARKYGNASQVVVFIAYTGLRVSEAIGLQWKNVSMDKREIVINQSLALVHEENEEHKKQYFHIKKGVKSADSKRIVPLPDKAIEVLQYFEKYRKQDDDFVFVNGKNGNHYTRRLVERTLERIVNNSECKDKEFTPHSLRHGYGSILLSVSHCKETNGILKSRISWDRKEHASVPHIICQCKPDHVQQGWQGKRVYRVHSIIAPNLRKCPQKRMDSKREWHSYGVKILLVFVKT